ncbi:hypothetical protein NL676_025492 [Syzygium grande]|nr:hypothetical protein NL676_025492 [Syzygium grande]
MERSTPVRKPHTSTSDLLTWSETLPPHDSVVPSSASSRSNARSHQPSDGISKVVFGGQVTAEKSENLNQRKSCSAYKLKEITGSGIFAANGEDDLLEPRRANPASNNKTGLKMYQVLQGNEAQIDNFIEMYLRPPSASEKARINDWIKVRQSSIRYHLSLGDQRIVDKHFIIRPKAEFEQQAQLKMASASSLNVDDSTLKIKHYSTFGESIWIGC